MGTIKDLDVAIKAVCPIRGVSSDRVIHFRPEATPEQRAAAQAIADGWVFTNIDTQEEIDQQAVQSAKADPVIQYLVNHTPDECFNKVQADVTDLASAKQMLGRFARALSVIAREKLR